MVFKISKMIVAASDSAADAIAALRAQLDESAESSRDVDAEASSAETLVNPDGSVGSSTEQGDDFKPVGKAVVADDSTSDAIAALRAELVDDETIQVSADTGVINPTETVVNPDGTLGSSTGQGNDFKPVGKAVVADDSVSDQIAALRQQLVSGEGTMVNPDGTVQNPADPMTASSLNGGGYKPVDKATVAAEVQWYQTNPALQRAEIKAMADIKPDAKMGYLPNGRMYWTVRLHPVVCGKRKDWTLIGVYDPDHPKQRWGGSVKFYPVKPDYDEMMRMVNQSFVTPKQIPHLLRDENNQIYMCTQHRNNIKAGEHKGEEVSTAAACLRFAMRWITVFELGLIDQKTWTLFQREGEI